MIKVLIISVGKLSGGIEKYTLMLDKMLSNCDCEIHFAIRKNGWLSKQLKNRNIIELNMNKTHIICSMLLLKKYVEEHNINIVHCNSNNAIFISLFIKEKIGRKKIAVIHGDVLIDQIGKGKYIASLYKFFEIYLLKKHCSYCIAVSKSMKEILVQRGMEEAKILVIYNGIEEVNYSGPPDYYSKILTICNASNLLPSKNHITLLNILKRLKETYPDIKFCCDIYGDGEERNMLQDFINQNGLNEVRLMGFDSEIRGKLNQYAIYIQPSLYESFGIAVTEAMLAGCCVIINQIGGMMEFVNEKTGFTVDCSDIDKTVEVIKYCFDHRNQIAKTAAQGQILVKNKFMAKKMVDNLYEFYSKILGVDL